MVTAEAEVTSAAPEPEPTAVMAATVSNSMKVLAGFTSSGRIVSMV